MCGFAGVLNLESKWTASPGYDLLESMAQKIVHRGPDEQGIYQDGPVGLAHRRLSIIDLASGQQPMLSADQNIAMVYNGEVFNYVELREQLVDKGHVFKTHSDTEVILHLYLEYGEDFVDYLNGQFAIAIWDKPQEKLILVRDRIGICPLFYTFNDGRIVFGSEVKALKPALHNGLRLSAEAMDQVFTFWAPVSPNTIFEDVFEVSPGYQMVVDKNGVRSRQYWDWEYDVPLHTDSEESLIGQLHDLLVDATKIRLRSDVPVGAYLSGGLDSSAIVALINKYGNMPLRTFSLNFDQGNYDEASFQSSLTRHLNTEHSNIVVSPDEIAKSFRDTVYHAEEPILRTAPVPMGLLSGLVRQNDFKVVLTGEGADEVLGGYDIFKEAKVRRFWAENPDSEWRPLLLKRLYPYLNIPEGKQSVFLKSFFGQGLEDPNQLFFSHLPRWTTTAKAKMFFSDAIGAELEGRAMEALSQYMPDKLAGYHPFNRSQYIESKTLMSGYLLCSQGDRMLTKNSVEGRFPFLDHRLIEFANKLPPKVKMKAMNEKYALKRAMAPYLPKDIIQRPKQPYRAPDVNTGTKGLVGEEFSQYLSEQAIEDLGFFNAKKVSMLIKKAGAGRALSTSESQAMVGILSSQILHAELCCS